MLRLTVRLAASPRVAVEAGPAAEGLAGVSTGAALRGTLLFGSRASTRSVVSPALVGNGSSTRASALAATAARRQMSTAIADDNDGTVMLPPGFRKKYPAMTAAEATNVFKRRASQRRKPARPVLTAVIAAVTGPDDLRYALEALTIMRERGATPGSRNAIDFARVCLDRCNDPKTLVKVITDVPTYNLKFDEPQFVFVLNKLSADGANARYAIKVFRAMLDAKLEPSATALQAVVRTLTTATCSVNLAAHTKAMQADSALELFDGAVSRGARPAVLRRGAFPLLGRLYELGRLDGMNRVIAALPERDVPSPFRAGVAHLSGDADTAAALMAAHFENISGDTWRGMAEQPTRGILEDTALGQEARSRLVAAIKSMHGDRSVPEAIEAAFEEPSVAVEEGEGDSSGESVDEEETTA